MYEGCNPKYILTMTAVVMSFHGLQAMGQVMNAFHRNGISPPHAQANPKGRNDNENAGKYKKSLQIGGFLTL